MTSGLKLHQRVTTHLKLGRGGYYYEYDVLHGDVIVGKRTVSRATKASISHVAYILDDQEYDNFAGFVIALQKKIGASA